MAQFVGMTWKGHADRFFGRDTPATKVGPRKTLFDLPECKTLNAWKARRALVEFKIQKGSFRLSVFRLSVFAREGRIDRIAGRGRS